MPFRIATIASPIGLHARPATDFSRKVKASGIPITVGRRGGNAVDAANVLAVMMLGIRCGESIVISTTQTGSEEVLDHLVSFLETAHEVTSAPTVCGAPLPEHA